mmetsp:Transcript_3571/g.6374  ORF Transcript_3571/g.6374 Transcript_3571/m.6374 type:complete len:256 (-) Transcript_3571:267-1034(-)
MVAFLLFPLKNSPFFSLLPEPLLPPMVFPLDGVWCCEPSGTDRSPLSTGCSLTSSSSSITSSGKIIAPWKTFCEVLSGFCDSFNALNAGLDPGLALGGPLAAPPLLDELPWTPLLLDLWLIPLESPLFARWPMDFSLSTGVRDADALPEFEAEPDPPPAPPLFLRCTSGAAPELLARGKSLLPLPPPPPLFVFCTLDMVITQLLINRCKVALVSVSLKNIRILFLFLFFFHSLLFFNPQISRTYNTDPNSPCSIT